MITSRFITIYLLTILCTANAAASLKRADSTILTDLKTVDSDLKKLTTAATNYDGSATSALTLINAEQTLDNDIKQTGKDIQASSRPLSSSTCQPLVTYLNGTIEPDVKQCATAMQSANAAYQKSGAGGSPCDACKTFKSDFDNLCNALISACASGTQAGIKAVCVKIDSDWDSCCVQPQGTKL